MKKRTGKQNFLEFIPVRAAGIEWKVKKNGLVELAMPNKGIFNKIAQVLFKKPKISYIELEEFGSFVWQQIDGKRDVHEIGQKVKAKFGDKAEPLYTRLCTYVKTLKNHKFIMLMKAKKED